MHWDPLAAKSLLIASSLVTPSGELKKICSFSTESGRELALSLENAKKVTIYLHPAPHNMPGIEVQELYPANVHKRGRHANLESITRTLGFCNEVFRVCVADARALEQLIGWYRYA